MRGSEDAKSFTNIFHNPDFASTKNLFEKCFQTDKKLKITHRLI